MKDTTALFRLFVTGTDTGVGKTHVTCLIARQLIAAGLRIAAYKPVCSGAIPFKHQSAERPADPSPRWDDIDRLKAATGENWPAEIICPQRLAPLAPPIAARREGKAVDFQQMIDGADRFGDVDGCSLKEPAVVITRDRKLKLSPILPWPSTFCLNRSPCGLRHDQPYAPDD